jgi:hypothetical protein
MDSGSSISHNYGRLRLGGQEEFNDLMSQLVSTGRDPLRSLANELVILKLVLVLVFLACVLHADHLHIALLT